MKYISTLALIGAIFSMSTCKAVSMEADVPAHISNPTAESRSELLRVVREALNNSQVTIADNALMADSLLIIEPKHLLGRDLRKPNHFRLMLSDSNCVLIHQETEARSTLTQTTCTAE
ncbi:MAG: hypothetical protein O7G86_09575 [Gammaproteobacteria bacterium]|nr:hypothetical protein [Gammaproteobacteria bacterium]